MDWQALKLSLRLSLVTTLVLLALGLPLAWWLSQTRWRGKFLLEALVTLPIVLPPTVLGFYLLLALGPNGWLGLLARKLGGGPLPFSFSGLLVASVCYSLPFAVQPFVAGFSAIEPGMLEASRTLGASKQRTFWRISFPLAWPGILTGMILCFAHTMGEFGVVLMVGGNLPGVTRTVSISIYDQVQSLDYAGAGTTSLFLLVVSFSILAVTYFLNPRFLWFRRSN